jgi:hypothetical protein
MTTVRAWTGRRASLYAQPDVVGGPERMRIHKTKSLLLLLLSACTPAAPGPQVAQLPPGLYGIYEDNDVGAINLSSWAFASPQRTFNDPVDAIKAVVAIEYLADELNVSPRWIGMSPFAKQEMVEARVEVRRVLGIVPDAQSQIVINALLSAAWQLQAGNQTEAARALGTPPFSLPPERTLQLLASLPFIRSANIATMDAAGQSAPQADGRRH